ncbi:MAG: hypothetical protein ACREJN_14760 [Nitrospiraceae bacterium]
MLELDRTDDKLTLESVGGGMLFAGTLALARWSRRKKNQPLTVGAAQTMDAALMRPDNRILPSLGIVLVAGGFLKSTRTGVACGF